MNEQDLQRALGELIGITKGISQAQEQMRADIRDFREESRKDNERIERALSDKIEAHKEATDNRFAAVDKRLDKLESKADTASVQIAKTSALTGTIGGALTAGAVEVIKHFFK
mgnify:CR=1 FL=1